MVPSPTHIENSPQTPTCTDRLRRRQAETPTNDRNHRLQDSGMPFSESSDAGLGEW